MGTNFKKVTYTVAMLFLSLVCHSVGYSQQVSKTVNYTAKFQPFGAGIHKTFALPSEVDPENHFQVGFIFDLKPEDIRANVTATLIFDQGNETLQIRGKDGELQSQGGINLQAFVKIACELPPILFATTEPVFVEVEIPFSVSNFLNAEVLKKLPSIGLPAINALDGWDTSESFNSLLFNGKPIELRGGIRELVRAELQATDIVEAIIDAVTKSVSVPLPPIALKALGKAFEIALGNAAISYNLGFLSTLTLTGQSITVNGEQLMSEDQIIKAPGLDLSEDTYTVDSSYEEQFTYQLDFVASSDVWLEFNPLGIPVWSYPKTVIAEFPSPLIPKQEVNLNFTSNQTTFPLTEALPAASLVAADAIDHQLLLVDGPSQTVDMAPYFSSQSGLIYEVSSSPSGVVTESVSGSRVTIAPLQIGNTSVIVKAFDRNDERSYAIQTIPVLVYTNRATIVRPPSSFTAPETSNFSAQGLAKGVSVIVQNTNRLGINIRSNPWVSNNNPDNRIGNVPDGATGTITDGPAESNGGFTWWKIDWDTVNAEGWSVDVFQGSQLLFPRPPDLEIRDFDVSNDDVKPGEEFRLEAEIRNNGPGKSEPTEIYFYYQTLDKEEDIRVAGKGKAEVPSLRKDERREVFLTVTAPMTPHTDYDYGAILPPDIPDTYDAELVDPTRQIRLNNIAEVVRVEVRSDPDLIVESISVRDGEVTLTPGEAFTLEATLRNQGIGEPERNATLHYYRSWDASISTRDREVGTDTVSSGNLDTNETEDESIRLTAPTEPGIYYYGACVDLKYESDTDNNCSGSVAITVRETRHSDLLVSLLTLSDNTLAPGASFTLQATVQNQGIGTARPTTLRSYQSSNASISPNDTEVGSVDVSSLSADETEIQAFTLKAPLAASTYYYGASIESVSNESNTANNYSTGVALRVENLAPVTVGTMPAATLAVEDLFLKVDLSPYFSDPNSDVLTYAVESAAPEVVKVDLSGVSSSILRMTPLAAGDATITVEVSDGEFTATQALVVSVTDDVSEASWMPDANLREAVRAALGLTPSDVLTQEALAELASVNFDNNDIKDLTGLEHATQLTNVSLGWNQVVDITPLSGLTRLTELHLRYTELVDLSPLSGLTQLTGLQLSGNQVVDLMPLVGLTRLTWLDLSWNQVVDVTPLAGLTRLTWLSLGSNQISDVSGLEGLINLEKLSLKENPVADLAPLRRLKSKNPGVDIDIDISDVTTVVSEASWMPDANLREAVREALGLAPGDVLTQQAMQGLTKLDAPLPWDAPASVKVSDLTGIEHATQLTELDLSWNEVVDISPLSALTRLTWLSLGSNQISDVSALEGLINLEKLSLKENPVVDLAPLHRLKSKNPGMDIDIDISVVTTVVSEASWMSDANLRTKVREALGLAPGDVFTQEAIAELTSISFANSGIKDLTGLEHATQLTTLDLRFNKIRDVSALSGLTQLTVLGLWANDIVDVSALSSLTQLTKLDLEANEVSDVSPLSGLTQLTWLDITSNKVSDVSPLSGLTQLTQLNLGSNEVSDVSALSGLTQLTKLYLWWNQISDVSAFEGLINLDQLILEGNPISDFAPLRRLKSKNPDVYIDIDISVVAAAVSEETWMPDANLRETVREALGVAPGDVLTQQAMQGLTKLDASLPSDAPASVKVSNLTGIEHATQLTYLALDYNDVSDVSPLSGLTQLTELDLTLNEVVDISPLSGLAQLTSLNLAGNDTVDISPLSSLTQLTRLSLTANKGVDVSLLLGLTQLTSLSLSGNFIGDVSLLSGLTQLTRLDLGLNGIVDVSPLSSLTQLTRLDLDENGLSDISVLSDLTQLTWLRLSDNEISDVSALEGLINLEDLYLEGNPIADFAPLRRLKSKNPGVNIDIDIGAVAAAVSEETWMPDANLREAVREALGLAPGDVLTQQAMQGLTKLDAPLPSDAPASVKVSDLTGIEHATQLTELVLTYNKVSNMSALSSLTQLTGLVLGDNEVVDISVLSGLTQLTGLVLGDNEVVDISVLSGLTQLTFLSLEGNDIVDVSPLSGLTQLTFLSLWGNDIVDVSPLSGLTQLTFLSLWGNDIVDVSPLSGLTQLTSLYLWLNDIVDVSPLSGLTQLTTLSLWGNNIVDVSPLSGLTQLTSLYLRGNDIVDVSPLSGLTQLTTLSLWGNDIVDVSPLSGLTQLTSLYLWGNDIVDVSPLSGLTQLTGLYLWLNDIVDVSPLSGLTQLTGLYLWGNDIVDVSPLSGLTQLTSLSLESNQISDVSALEGLINLEDLYLKGNPIANLAPLHRLKAKNPDVDIDIDIGAVAAAPAAPMLSVETLLLPNYPNPFNPETWIPYQLAKPVDVTMSIYSVDGRLVRTLALGYQSAGVYRSRNRAAHWDGRNNVGERVASGLYFYTFTAGDFTATRKMIIRK